MKLLQAISAYVHQVSLVNILYLRNDNLQYNFLQGINCESPVRDQGEFEAYLGRLLLNEEAIIKRLKEKVDENLSNRFFKY
jgi:hypothetical protein